VPSKEVIMFAGHIGAALALGRVERRVNLGAFVCAALLLDVVLWLFVLLGWESVTIPADFGRTHQPAFVFPYSHGLLAAIAWSALAGIATALWCARRRADALRAAAWVGLAVFSHWLLDALVHAPELPLAGEHSTKVGFGLWNSMPVALAVEALIAVGGLWLFVAGAQLARGRKIALTALVLVALAFTVLGMTVAPAPPSITAMASSSLVTIVVVCALAGWLGKRAV
jgi:membrane-bound metal-dependent hydrolase YbcI (DUF457 family)